MLDVKKIRQDFPIFKTQPRLVYLDSTATSLKPKKVIDKAVEYYKNYSANIFRGVYKISERATQEYEETREIIAKFINAQSEREVIFTRNTTESINLIAYGLGRKIVGRGDQVVTTIVEHHSNFVPWQVLALETGADFIVINTDKQGYLGQIQYKKKGDRFKDQYQKYKEFFAGIINSKTRIFSLTSVSNVLGIINPIKAIVQAVKDLNPNLIVVIDGAQAVPHLKIDVQDLGGDFFAFSSHKILGPTGVGVLWGREDLLKEMFPFQYGGEMIKEVKIKKTSYKEPPYKFEAGTPSIAEVIGLKEAVRYLQNIGYSDLANHEREILAYAFDRLKKEFNDKIKIVGPTDLADRCSIISFNFKDYHPHDVAQLLDEEGIAVRAGHHCAMPLHRHLGLGATVRASFYLYNDKEDVDKLIKGLKKIEKILG